MKKLILIAVLFVFPMTSFAFSAVSPATPVTPVLVDVPSEPTVETPRNEGGSIDVMGIMNPWGLTGYDTPRIECDIDHPISGSLGGCFDLTGTDFFKNQMRAMVKQLKSEGRFEVFRFAYGQYENL